MKRKLQEYVVSSPVFASRATSVHRASDVDHDADDTSVSNRILSSIRCSRTVSRRYSMIDGPSAIDFSCVHGLNENPRVCMSLSERTPGYRKRSHVPPMSLRPSRIANVRSGHLVFR
jgi:hypothetical protein